MKKLLNLVLPFLILTGCNNSNTAKPNHNYHETKECLISWCDVFTQEEDDYLVYFYSERCGYCNDIKQSIISFYLEEKAEMYFVCTDIEAVFGQSTNLTGVDSIDEFYIFGTPFLIRLLDHRIESYYVGSKQILNFINQF